MTVTINQLEAARAKAAKKGDFELLQAIDNEIWDMAGTANIYSTSPTETLGPERAPWNPNVSKAQIEKYLPGKIDWKGEAGHGLRWNLASGEGFEEKKARFKDAHPTGDIELFQVRGDLDRMRHLRTAYDRATQAGDLPRASYFSNKLEEEMAPVSGANFMAFRESPGADWRIVNQPGATTKDVTDVASAEAVPVLGAMAAGAAVGSGVGTIPTLAALAAGAAGGKLLEEGAETMAGYQRQSLGDVALDAAVKGGEEVLLPGVGRAGKVGLRRLFPESLGARMDPQKAQDYRAIAGLMEQEQLDPLTKGQAVWNPLAQAQAANLNKISGRETAARLETSTAAGDVLRREAIEQLATPQTRRSLADAARNLENVRREGALLGYTPGPLQAGTAGKTAIATWQKAMRGTETQKRLGVEQAANRETPVFSMSSVKDALTEMERKGRVGYIDARGNPIEAQRVPAEWTGLGDISTTIRNAGDEQVDYRFIQGLRQQADDLSGWGKKASEVTPAEAKARQLRKRLDEILKDPVNKEATPEFAARVADYDKFYTDYSRTRESENLLDIIRKGRNVEAVIAEVSANPGGLLSKELRTAIRSDPGQYSTFRKGIARQVLTGGDGGAEKRLLRMRERNESVSRFLFPGDEFSQALDSARLMDEYSKSPAAKIAADRSSLSKQLSILFDKFDDAADLRQVLGSVSQTDPLMPRKMLYSHLADKTLRKVVQGSSDQLPDSQALTTALSDLNSRGMLREFLSPEEIGKLQGLEALLRRGGMKGDDFAAALELQKLVADMTHWAEPTQMLNAYMEVWSKSGTAAALLRKRFTPKKLRKMADQAEKGQIPINRMRTQLQGAATQALDGIYRTYGTGYGESPE